MRERERNYMSCSIHRQQLKSSLFSHPILASVSELDNLWSIAEKRIEGEETTLETARENYKQKRRRQKRYHSPG